MGGVVVESNRHKNKPQKSLLEIPYFSNFQVMETKLENCKGESCGEWGGELAVTGPSARTLIWALFSRSFI